MRSQKEITLKDDLSAKDRLDIYRNFLLYCMSGDVVALPMGSTGATRHCQHLIADGSRQSSGDWPSVNHRARHDGMATCQLSRYCMPAHEAGRKQMAEKAGMFM